MQLGLFAPPPEPLVVAVTGHRPDDRRPWRGVGSWSNRLLHVRVKLWLRAQLVELAPARVITGMALGVDTWFAECALELGIPFTAAIPFVGQEARWPAASQERYHALLKLAVEVVNVTGHNELLHRAHHGRPSSDEEISRMMKVRNRWMVQRCGLLLSVWDGSPGGTSHCVRYAEDYGRRTIRCNPEDFRSAA